MKELSIPQVQRRTADEMYGQAIHVSRSCSQFSLVQLINAQIKHPLWALDSRSLDVAYELSNGCRQTTGQAPSGIWVPISALTRSINTSSSASLSAPATDKTIRESFSEGSAVMTGCTLLSGLSGSEFRLPSFANSLSVSAAWLADGETVPEIQPAFGSVSISPKTIAFTFDISRRLLQQNNVNLENQLRTEIASRLMNEIDRAALVGVALSGVSGIMHHADLQVLSAGVDGAAPDWSHLVEAEYQVSERMGTMQKPAFILSPKLRKKFRTTPKGAGLGFILDDESASLLGHEMRVTSLMPDDFTKGTSTNCSGLLFGDLSEIFVGFWGPLAVDLLVDGLTQARNGLIRLTARCEVGVAVRNITSFAAYKDFVIQ